MQVEIDGVSKVFGGIRALNQVRLELQPGTVYAMLGSNGAGKTTLLQVIYGLLTPSEGVVRFDGVLFSREDLQIRRGMFYLPDFPVFFPNATVLSHIATVLHLYEAEREDVEKEAAELLDKFEILPFANAPTALLSRGQAYKAALTALVLTKPRLWLIDEPMASGMDPNGLRLFKQLARQAADEGATILYTTQIAEVAQQLADQVIFLNEADVAAVDSPAGLMQKTGSGNLEEALEKTKTPSK